MKFNIGVILIIMLIISLGFVAFEFQFNTKPIRENCRDGGYDSAYHSNRGWYCYKDVNGTEMAIKYHDLMEEVER